MPDCLSPDQRHHAMAAIRSASTKPELELRHALWRLGFRYLVNDKRLPGKPDIVLPKYRTVVFIHGCFWHGHIGCKHYSVPTTNTDYWVAKVARNQERDQVVWRQLEAKDWAVIIVWECQLGRRDLDATVRRVTTEILHNGELHDIRQKERRLVREQYRRERKARMEKETELLAEIQHLT